MPSNQTANYQLSQWERTDKVLMDDFNADNAAIDAALGEHAGLLSKLGNCRIEVQSYTGTGTFGADNPNRLTFSGKPSFILIAGSRTFAMGFYGKSSAPLVSSSGAYAHNSTMSYTWSGNQVGYYCTTVSSQMNETGQVYHVLALYAEDQK